MKTDDQKQEPSVVVLDQPVDGLGHRRNWQYRLWLANNQWLLPTIQSVVFTGLPPGAKI